jgi:hypothetical protein
MNKFCKSFHLVAQCWDHGVHYYKYHFKIIEVRGRQCQPMQEGLLEEKEERKRSLRHRNDCSFHIKTDRTNRQRAPLRFAPLFPFSETLDVDVDEKKRINGSFTPFWI